jgi:hypothetical protein
MSSRPFAAFRFLFLMKWGKHFENLLQFTKDGIFKKIAFYRSGFKIETFSILDVITKRQLYVRFKADYLKISLKARTILVANEGLSCDFITRATGCIPLL